MRKSSPYYVSAFNSTPNTQNKDERNKSIEQKDDKNKDKIVANTVNKRHSTISARKQNKPNTFDHDLPLEKHGKTQAFSSNCEREILNLKTVKENLINSLYFSLFARTLALLTVLSFAMILLFNSLNF